VIFTSGYPSQSGLTLVTKAQAWDVGGGIASVLVKVQAQDAGVLSDVTSFSAATADDGSFGSPIEVFTHTTSALSIRNGQPTQVVVKVTDTSGNSAMFTSAIIGNGGNWSTSPSSTTDTVPPTLVGTGCIDPLTSFAANGCGVNTSATTPSSNSAVVFSAFASDDVAVTGAEFAVSKPGSGDTVVSWTACSAADGAFGGKLETVACTAQFPTAATSAGGTRYVILVRAIDAGGNKSTPVDPANGAFGPGEFCTFFLSQYANGGGGSSTTANCLWTYDNKRPYLAQAERSFGTIAPNTPVDQNSLMVLAFSESMRAISTTNPQSITVTDGARIVTLASGVNATFARCFAGITINTPGNCASTNDGSVGTGMTWQIVPMANTGLFYPLTVTGFANFRDYAGNSVDPAAGDQTID
jgi:hypothetical protein